MLIKEAKDILNKNGYILESRDTLTTKDVIQGLSDLGIEVEDRDWEAYKKPIIKIYLGWLLAFNISC